MNKRILIATTSAVSLLASVATPAFGAVSCVTQYGTSTPYGQVCVQTGEIQINKEVFNPNPNVNKFVDNITSTGTDAYLFAPGQEVKFKLTIKNIGDNTLNNVEVTDTLPSFLEQVAGQEYRFNIDTLAVNQSVQKEITARVVEIAKLPKDADCDFNLGVAKSGDKIDQDKAQVCYEKKAVKELPKAGAEDTLAMVFSSGILGYVGLKFAKIKKLNK